MSVPVVSPRNFPGYAPQRVVDEEERNVKRFVALSRRWFYSCQTDALKKMPLLYGLTALEKSAGRGTLENYVLNNNNSSPYNFLALTVGKNRVGFIPKRSAQAEKNEDQRKTCKG